MKIPLSDRLQACCSFITPGARVADVGCDHGYLGIHLLREGIASAVIASDVNEQPLQSAVINAERFGVRDRMAFYLSDGVRNIPRDFDTLVCAGMGADTMISILEAAPWLRDQKYELILQCQSRRPVLRQYLSEKGFAIEAETLARDGKFIYPVMKIRYCPGHPLSEGECHMSPALMACDSPLLEPFYNRVTEGLKCSAQGLERSGQPEKARHFYDILNELQKMYNSRR